MTKADFGPLFFCPFREVKAEILYFCIRTTLKKMKTHTLTLSLALLYALLPAQAPLRLSPPFSLGGYTVSAENACALAANPSALAFQRTCGY